MKPRIYDERNGLWYTLCGDYYVPELSTPKESRPIGKWGQMHITLWILGFHTATSLLNMLSRKEINYNRTQENNYLQSQ